MSETEIIKQAQELIKARRYDEARHLLQGVQHPMADQLLEQIKQIGEMGSMSARGVQPGAKRDDWMNQVIDAAESQTQTQSGGSAGGAILLLIASVVGGLAVGALLFLTSKLLYLIIASIAIAGALAGLILSLIFQWAKIRNVALAWIFGILIGLIMYGTFRYAEYLDFVQETRRLADEEAGVGVVSDDDLNTFIDEFLLEETGSSGLIGFFRLQAKEGMTIQRTSASASSDGITLNQELTVAYWIIEVLIAVGVPIGMAARQAKQYFCEQSNTWLKMRGIGVVLKNEQDNFLKLLQSGYFADAGRLIQAKGRSNPLMTVEVGRCDEYAADGFIRVTRQVGNNRKVMVDTKVSRDAFNALTNPDNM